MPYGASGCGDQPGLKATQPFAAVERYAASAQDGDYVRGLKLLWGSLIVGMAVSEGLL